MKKLSLFILLTLFWHTSNAADLIEVYQQALVNDAVFAQAISQRLATKEGVPISFGALLPNINLSANPNLNRIGYAGTSYQSTIPTIGSPILPRNITTQNYALNLSVTQTVFNYAQFATVAQQISLSKGADATLNAALQSLMTRVASAYFAVLKDEDNLRYSEATKLAFAEQLDQIRQQYKVGLKTLTDVYTAQASYDSASANYIQAQINLTNDRENLRVITGVYYPHLLSLSDDFPLISPLPSNVEKWVQIAVCQNWSIKSAQYNVDASRAIIHQQFGGHLPTVSVQAAAIRTYTNSINKYNTVTSRNGPGTESDRQVMFNVNVPIFSGGTVTALTNQAVYNYQVTQESLEQTIRNTINTTRQSFNSITSGISQIEADKQAIKSTISSLEGLEASYNVGTETLVDVLNQQQKVFQAQTQYATDRYAFVNNILALKQAAGTLSFADLRAINAWLVERQDVKINRITARKISKKKHKITIHHIQQKKCKIKQKKV